MFSDKYAFFFKNILMKLFYLPLQMNICAKNKKEKRKSGPLFFCIFTLDFQSI